MMNSIPSSLLQRKIAHVETPRADPALKAQQTKFEDTTSVELESESLDAYTREFLGLVQKAQDWLKQSDTQADMESKVKIEQAKAQRSQGVLKDPAMTKRFENDVPINLPTR